MRTESPAPGHPQTAEATRLVLRPLANPLSLGFLGLAFATVLYSGLELGWVPVTEGRTLAVAVLVFTVPVQMISSVFGFLTRDLVAASGMGVLAGTWGATALSTLLSPPGSTSDALGLILATSSAAVLMPAIGAARTKLLAAVVMTGTTLRWILTSGYEWGGGGAWKTAAGCMGLVLAGLALYGSLAFELEDQNRATILPTFRRRAGILAMTGDLAEQVSHAANEAGVRKQL